MIIKETPSDFWSAERVGKTTPIVLGTQLMRRDKGSSVCPITNCIQLYVNRMWVPYCGSSARRSLKKIILIGNTSKRAWKVRMRVRHEESGWWDMVENYFPWIHWGQQEWESPAMLSTPQAHRFLRSSWGPVSTSHSWVLSTRTMLQQVSCHHGIPT